MIKLDSHRLKEYAHAINDKNVRLHKGEILRIYDFDFLS